MPTLRTGLLATGAALLASAVSVIAVQGSGSAAPAAPPAPAALALPAGIATLRGTETLPPGTWVNTPLQVRLPRPGTYAIDANVRGRLQGIPALNTFITARLWNVTSGAEVQFSDRIVNQEFDLNPRPAAIASNRTAPIAALVTVTRPTTIRLQARDVNVVGAATVAQLLSDSFGYTTLRFMMVST